MGGITALGLYHCFHPRHSTAAFGLSPALPSALNSRPACTCLLDPSTWRPAHVSGPAIPSSPQILSVFSLGFPGFVNGSCVSRYKPAIIFPPASPPPDLPSSVSIFHLQLLCSHGHCCITESGPLLSFSNWPPSLIPPLKPPVHYHQIKLSPARSLLFEKPPLTWKHHCLAHILTYSPSRLDPHTSFQPPLPSTPPSLSSRLPSPLNPAQRGFSCLHHITEIPPASGFN
uniref:Uncharacterized protein n=1 Tax=Pongo abelii TaxID=9601 RepID=A0A8I5TSZ9_PONAB